MYNTNTRIAPDIRNDFTDNVNSAEYEQYLHRQYIKAELEKTQRQIDAGEVEWFDADEVLAEARKQLEESGQL